MAAAIAQPKAYADALAEARAIPEAFLMHKGSSNPNPGRVILRVRDKPKPPCKKCKRSKKKSKKKKCSKCSGIYPIPYPGNQSGKPNRFNQYLKLLFANVF